jgi:hypothetical protein
MSGTVYLAFKRGPEAIHREKGNFFFNNGLMTGYTTDENKSDSNFTTIHKN